MNPRDLFELIVAALSELPADLHTESGRRVRLAYLAARSGLGADGGIEGRIVSLREELGL